MKKQILKPLALSACLLAFVACKNDNKNEVKPGEAEEVAEMTEQAARYQIRADQSEVQWWGNKPTGEHHGTIKIDKGWFSIKNGQIESGEVVIDMKSIEVLDEGMDEEYKTMLENHLKGTAEGKETDFFNVEKYPTATFKITGLSSNGEDVMLEGNLNIKDKTHNIAFPVELSWATDKSSIKLISEPFTIDRTHWGVNYGSKSIFPNLGDKWISDEIRLQIAVKAVKESK